MSDSVAGDHPAPGAASRDRYDLVVTGSRIYTGTGVISGKLAVRDGRVAAIHGPATGR